MFTKVCFTISLSIKFYTFNKLETHVIGTHRFNCYRKRLKQNEKGKFARFSKPFDFKLHKEKFLFFTSRFRKEKKKIDLLMLASSFVSTG